MTAQTYKSQRQYRSKNKAAGICPYCVEKAVPGRTLCVRHISYQKWWREVSKLVRDGLLVKLPDGRWALTVGDQVVPLVLPTKA